MPAGDIVIKGAREHNLQSVDVVLPRNKLICLTGVSGSGKSSLAFDTLYAEGQRRYVEGLSSFARQFLGQMPKPEVDYIGGLSPSISISQKTAGTNPRSTVGTITEIYDYLRVLFARVGQGYCPQCQRPITAQTREQILARIEQLPAKTRFMVLAPLIRRQRGEYRDLFEDLRKQGFARARVDGRVVSLTDDLNLDRQMRHDIEVVVDRLTMKRGLRPRLAEAVELALKMGDGALIVSVEEENSRAAASALAELETADNEDNEDKAAPAATPQPAAATPQPAAATDLLLSAHYACTHCGLSFETPSPQLFSFNSPQGMCPECDGLGKLYTFDPDLLITDPGKSLKQGCIELLGRWKDMGRWRRHIYQGVADTMERKHDLEEGVLLNTPWRDLRPEWQDWWLMGTDDEHITFTWRGGDSPIKYGGQFEGIIPKLLEKYRSSKSKVQLRQLESYMNAVGCPRCHGQRLNPQARAVRITSENALFAENPSLTLPEVCHLSIADAAAFFQGLVLNRVGAAIAQEAVKEIRGRLGFLLNVGLDYLTLDRTSPTLSGGESQRIRLAGQIGCGLVSVLYILDEPSIGLHPRDNDRLLETLAQLRDLGNTVLVVEHDEDTMRAADHILDFGPGPGVRGGELVASGTAAQVQKEPRSVTGQFLAGKLQIDQRPERRPPTEQRLRVVGARHNNLKNIDVEIPLGLLVCVTGVSGSGKSSLVNDILSEVLRRDLNWGDGDPGAHERIEGIEHLDKLIAIDQSPIGRTPRSNPGTYIKVLDDIRALFAQMPEAKRRGYKPGRFSFNVQGGRCEACEGNGANKLEMDFLADVWVTCPVCGGHRFNRETLQVKFKDRTIAEVLEMDVQQALELFDNIPKVQHKLQTLHDVGLDYLKLGQPSPTLSGGEAQRIKLARELVKKSTGKTLYLLDEPTTGLHFADIKMLLKVLHDFVDAGNTVLIVEHNLDVIKTADWVIDLGPEGGAGGGQVVAAGTPEEIAERAFGNWEWGSGNGDREGEAPAEPSTGRASGAHDSGPPPSALGSQLKSYTGEALARVLKPSRRRKKAAAKKASRNGRAKHLKDIVVQGARQHNLKGVDVKIERNAMTAFCGPSGSGKSSLAMDTIYAEGQRRYVESLSSYARQFVSQMQKPQLDHIEGLSPAIAIEQKNFGQTPRSTVGTVTEIYDYFRILMARVGQPYCPDCEAPIGTQTADEITDKIMTRPEGQRLYLMAPVEVEVGRRYDTLWKELREAGFARVRIDGETLSLDDAPAIDRRRQHKVEVVVDRIVVRPSARSRIAESVEAALSVGKGVLHVAEPRDDAPEPKWTVVRHSQQLACDRCGRSFEPLTPHNFSFNSRLGWCESCEGLATQTGANPAALLNDPKLSLAEGAVALWPDLHHEVARLMLEAFCRGADLPLNVPFEQLSARQRRVVMYGTGDQWFQVEMPPPPGKKTAGPSFRFQYKGLYPALEEAARLSPGFRTRLEHLVDEVECAACGGSRLREDASAVRFRNRTIDDYCRLPLGELQRDVQSWRLDSRQKKIAGELVREIKSRVQFLCDVGLEYLTLGRGAATLSGGEAQRIRLASQLGSGLCGVLYVLDEPTIGLHPRDNRRLLAALHKLRDLGNTLLVVEHDREVLTHSDQICDFGPGAGKLGGQVVAHAPAAEIAKKRKSVTGPYLSGKRGIPTPTNRRVAIQAGGESPHEGKTKTQRKASSKKRGAAAAGSTGNGFAPPAQWLTVRGARHNNLQNIDVALPLRTLTAVTGVSGSGKSSLVNDVLYAALAKRLHRASTTPGAHVGIDGIEHINKVIRVDQQPLGNSPTSNPATYTGAFDLIRTMFAQLPESKVRGYTPRRFSFNAQGGRCEDCEGNGRKCIEMHFLPDVWVECETCRGQRYNPETLAVEFRGRSINDVLEMTCREARDLFENVPKIRRILQTLCDVGLDYLGLGQPAPTLSGGEAQRVKLAAELARPDTGQTLYLLDEPTTGLHFSDLVKLLEVLHRLVDLGNTVVVIEHNLDVIKQADWIIDMGPEAGAEGGRVVVAGTPEQVAAHSGSREGEAPAEPSTAGQAGSGTHDSGPPLSALRPSPHEASLRSYTAEALAPVLAEGPHQERRRYDPAAHDDTKEGDLDLEDVGRDAKMPWQIDGRRWHARERVGRRGEPVRWDGRILERVIDRIHELGEFSDTNWDNRTVVEITGPKKSAGWFFHAITGEAWLLKMKFRMARGSFQQGQLNEQLDLKPLNQMDDLPVYGNEPRVKVKNQRGPWQEVEIRAHTLVEIDTPPFWEFLDRAVVQFGKVTERAAENIEDHMPWKKLGQRWHLSRKGFQPGKKIRWNLEVLEELFEMLTEAAPGGQFLWNNQVLVHYYLPEGRDPWATVVTKRAEWVELGLRSAKGDFTMGRIAEIGVEPEFDASRSEYDLARLRFRTTEDLHRGNLAGLLEEYAAAAVT